MVSLGCVGSILVLFDLIWDVTEGMRRTQSDLGHLNLDLMFAAFLRTPAQQLCRCYLSLAGNPMPAGPMMAALAATSPIVRTRSKGKVNDAPKPVSNAPTSLCVPDILESMTELVRSCIFDHSTAV